MYKVKIAKIKRRNIVLCSLLVCLLLNSCTEPYALQTNSYEEALVVEATITNELKKQEIKISKTFRFEEEGPEFESGATVFIEDNAGNTYEFKEKEDTYVSTKSFQAIPERKYNLNITTKDGKTYTSKKETLTPITQIESVTTNVITKDNVNGVQISVNSFDPSGKSKFYRYEYEETYSIITPLNFDKIGIYNTNTDLVELIPNNPNDTCYSSNKSIEIHLASSVGLVEDHVNYPIRFISDQDPIIQNRYSILVRQYTQNTEAYTYYQTLKKTAESDNLLTQTQPGFFYGNVKCTTNTNEKVVGYFQVSAVSTARIFFNYVDIFPKNETPPYFYDCITKTMEWCNNFPYCPDGESVSLTEDYSWIVTLYSEGLFSPIIIPLKVAPRPCVDCTLFSSNKKPSFWKD
jgi:hypothetical protein